MSGEVCFQLTCLLGPGGLSGCNSVKDIPCKLIHLEKLGQLDIFIKTTSVKEKLEWVATLSSQMSAGKSSFIFK